MKKLFLLFVLVFGINSVFAVSAVLEKEKTKIEKDINAKEIENSVITPIMVIPDYVKPEEEIILDASDSKLVSISSWGNPSFSWNLGNEEVKFGEKISVSFKDLGPKKIKLNIKQGKQKQSIEKEIYVYKKEATFIVDDSFSGGEELKLQAAENGVKLNIIQAEYAVSDLSSENVMDILFQNNLAKIGRSNAIIFYTSGVNELNSFAKFFNKFSDENKIDLKLKLMVQISPHSLTRVAKIIQPVFDILKPHFILLTRSEALNTIFAQDSFANVLTTLKNREIEFEKVDNKSRVSMFLPLSNIMNFFARKGLSHALIYVLLAVPFLGFIISFFRQFVGVSTFGVYAPLMLAMAFLVLGLKFGFVVFLVVMLVSILIRLIFDKVELLYIPRVALLFSSLALSFFLVLGVAVYLGTSLDLSLAIFPMMVLSTLSEKFLSAQSAQGIKSALFLMIETVLIAMIGYAFVEWAFIKNNIMAMPELVILPILGTVWLGKFTGLRVSEYFKFRTLLTEDSQE